jgi:hypothetical protein
MRQLGTQFAQVQDPNLTPAQRQAFRAVATQKRITAYPYYSTVTFGLAKVGEPPGPYLWAISRGEERRAFSYGKGELMVNAGAPTTVATPVDTNLVQAAETISGENVEIHGIGIMLKQSGLFGQEAANPQLLADLQTHCSCDLSLNGDQNRFHLGSLSQLPGAGGLTGAGKDLTGATSLDGGENSMSFANNGWPTRSNFFRMPEGLVWRNKGMADSQMNVIFRVERDITVYSGGNLTNNVNGLDLEAGIMGVQAYNYPQQIEVTLLVHLMGRVVGPRTRSA